MPKKPTTKRKLTLEQKLTMAEKFSAAKTKALDAFLAGASQSAVDKLNRDAERLRASIVS